MPQCRAPALLPPADALPAPLVPATAAAAAATAAPPALLPRRGAAAAAGAAPVAPAVASASYSCSARLSSSFASRAAETRSSSEVRGMTS